MSPTAANTAASTDGASPPPHAFVTTSRTIMIVAAKLNVAEGDDMFREEKDSSTPKRCFKTSIERGGSQGHYLVTLPKLPWVSAMRHYDQVVDCPSVATAGEIVASYFCHCFKMFSQRGARLICLVGGKGMVFYGPVASKDGICESDAHSFIVENCMLMAPMLSCYPFLKVDALQEEEEKKKRKFS